jgi:NIMA (never in mitosis gene a)-related kinase
MSTKDFEIISVLGKGAYGCVYKVRRYADDKFYAMKKIIFTKLDLKEREACLNEVRFLASITNNNIISYKEAFIDNETNTLNIIMEYADDGDLENHILENKKCGRLFPEEKIWTIFLGIVNGLKALHDRKIMHRDLKSANIFLFKDGIVKIGDMNVSKVYRIGVSNTQTGTPYYASPEVWKDQQYDYKCDIWSLGCVLYEMCTNKVPFIGESIQQVFIKVCKGFYEPISLMYPDDLKDFINLLLQVNPYNRPYIDRLIYLLKRKENKLISSNKFENLAILKTIRIPRNLNDINLPKPQYRDTKR